MENLRQKITACISILFADKYIVMIAKDDKINQEFMLRTFVYGLTLKAVSSILKKKREQIGIQLNTYCIHRNIPTIKK